MRRRSAITAVITLPLILVLSACGYKGPLYLPPPKPAAPPPVSTQTPAAAAQQSPTQKPGQESGKP
jgi:predicted small lipoprotein YifL